MQCKCWKSSRIAVPRKNARIREYKMINYDDYTNENKTEHNPKWSYIPDHLYRILIIGASGLGKTKLNNVTQIKKTKY